MDFHETCRKSEAHLNAEATKWAEKCGRAIGQLTVVESRLTQSVSYADEATYLNDRVIQVIRSVTDFLDQYDEGFRMASNGNGCPNCGTIPQHHHKYACADYDTLAPVYAPSD